MAYYHATNTGKGFITHADNESAHVAGYPGDVWITENATWATRVGATSKTQAEAQALVDASIDAIIVSDLQRTQLTAQPLADYLDLQLIVIPIQELGVQNYIQGVVNEINNNWSGKEVLVVTHNPLYQLIGQALNTPELPAIDDATGYDHFFVITKSSDPSEQVKLSHTRYGAETQKNL